jgi:hypothetical protein
VNRAAPSSTALSALAQAMQAASSLAMPDSRSQRRTSAFSRAAKGVNWCTIGRHHWIPLYLREGDGMAGVSHAYIGSCDMPCLETPCVQGCHVAPAP